jgi:hypothetical protein
MILDRASVLVGIPDELGTSSDLLRSLNGPQLGTTTRCAGWTVADVAGHVFGTSVDITGRKARWPGNSGGHRRAAKGTGRAQRPRTGRRAGEPTRRSRPSFALEAIWFDTYLRGDDVRVAMGAPPMRGLARRGPSGYGPPRAGGWGPATLALDGIERVAAGGAEITAAPRLRPGRHRPWRVGGPGARSPIDVYADRFGVTVGPPQRLSSVERVKPETRSAGK